VGEGVAEQRASSPGWLAECSESDSSPDRLVVHQGESAGRTSEGRGKMGELGMGKGPSHEEVGNRVELVGE
jgi:hypothetical protein